MIDEIVGIMRSGRRCDTRGLKKANRHMLSEWSSKVNRVLVNIKTDNITDTNEMICAVAQYVSKKVGLRVMGRNVKKEPWWKRRIQNTIRELRSHVNILQRKKRGKLTKGDKYKILDRKYRIKTKGEDTVIEELKQRLQAKATKLKRYENRIQQFKINRSFQQDQKKVYQELSGLTRTEGVTPDAAESERFWSTIWGNEAQHNRDAQWLKDLREECDKVNQQGITITLETVTERVKKIPNWKAPGPNGVQGYWLKKLTSLHDRIAEQMNELVNNRAPLLVWMTTGRTVLCQKDPKKGNVVENYRPISCLLLL